MNVMPVIFQYPEFDLSTVSLRREPLEKRADVLEGFDANVGKFEKLLAECNEKTLGEKWTLRHGDHIILREPRAIALRTLRLLDIPVPGIYGPSADEEAQ